MESVGAMAQSYRPMLVKGMKWVYDYHHFVETEYVESVPVAYDEEIRSMSFQLEGDTLINGKTYEKVYCLDSDDKKSYYNAVREEGKTVFVVRKTEQDERVLMSFDPEVIANTDEYRYEYKDGITEKTDEVIVNENLYQRHRYSSNKGFELTAVEGVGFMYNGLIIGMSISRPTCICDFLEFTGLFDEKGELLFSNSDFSKEGVSTGLRSVGIQNSRSLHSIFDLQGRRVKHTPQEGIYIQEGKKKVVH